MSAVNLYIFITAHGPRKQDGAFGWVLESIRPNGDPDPRTLSGVGVRQQTIDRNLVLEAIAQALSHLSKPCEVTVILDPAYLAETTPTPWEQGWVENWEKNGWKNAKGQEIKNADLWKNALAVLRNHHAVFTKVRGHNTYKSWALTEIDRALQNNSGVSDDPENKDKVYRAWR